MPIPENQQLSFEMPDQPFIPDLLGLVTDKERTKICQCCKNPQVISHFAMRWSGAYNQRKIRDTTCNDCKADRDRLYKARSEIKQRTVNYRKKYYSSDPESQVIRMANIRAKKLGVKGQLTVHEWREVKELYGNHCVYCGISSLNLELDHLWPLSLANKDLDTSIFATNDTDNIVPACAYCNRAKLDKPFIIMLGWKNGLLN